MALDMNNSSIGVSREGMVKVKESIKINLIDESISSINTNVEQLNSNIDNYWHGAAADAFELKVNSEKAKVITILKVLEAKMELDLGVMATNSAIADAEVAVALGGSANGSGAGQSGSNNSIGSDIGSTGNNNTWHPAYNQGTTEPGGVYPQPLVEDPTSTPERDNYEAQNISVDNYETQNIPVNDDEVPEYVDTWYGNLWLGVQKTGATIATGGVSLIEGLGQFGEAIVDTGAIIGTGLCSLGSLSYDAGTYIASKITGSEWHSSTEEMWNATMAYVAEDNCKWMFDCFYEDTAIGQTLSRYSYGFDTTRGVGTGIGYTAGVVAIAVGTAGIGTGALGVGAAGTTATATTASMQAALPTAMGAVGATAGFGRGTQEAWGKGANLGEGLAYGAAKGAWEGAQFYLGGKINGLNVFKGANGVMTTGQSVANAGIRVGLDTIDSGAEGFVQPLLQTIYSDKTYGQLFEEAGGMDNVVTQAALGGGLSFAGEASGLAKRFRTANNVPADVQVPSLESYSIGEINDELSRVKRSFSVSDSYRISEEEIQKTLENGDFNSLIGVLQNRLYRDAPVEEALIDRLVQQQDQFMTMADQFSIGRIQECSELISRLSDDNLCEVASIGTNIGPNMMAELTKRIEDGHLLFSNRGHEFIFLGASDRYNTALNQLRVQNTELFNKLVAIYNKSANNIPPEIRSVVNSTPGKRQNQLIQLARLSSEGAFDESSMRVFERIRENPSQIPAINFGMLDKAVISELGEDFVVENARFSNISRKLLSIRESRPDLYQAYRMMLDHGSMDNSLGTLDFKTSGNLDFLFRHQYELDNIEHIDLKELQEYIYMNRDSNNPIDIDFSNNFRQEYAAKLDNIVDGLDLSKPESLDTLKDSYFRKYFSSTPAEMQALYDKYIPNIQELASNPEYSGAISVMTKINEINNITDPNVLKSLYDSQNFRFSAEELSHIDDLLGSGYTRAYSDKLRATMDGINSSAFETVQVGDVEVKIREMTDDFGILVHSSDSGFTGSKKLINDSLKDTFLGVQGGQTHALATSYISNSNIGCAPVGGNGVLYGFTDLDSGKIRAMGAQDIDSHITSPGFTSGVQQQFFMPDQIGQQTTKVYNEVMIDRNSLTPDYIVLMSDASDQVRENSLKAAAEWGIDIVRIDVDKLANDSLSSVRAGLDSFTRTGNFDDLRTALTTYESSASGFKLNVDDFEKWDTHTSVQSLYQNSGVNEYCINYAQQIVDSGDTAAISQFRSIIEDIQSRYANTNERDGLIKVVSPTSSMINIDEIMKVLGE